MKPKTGLPSGCIALLLTLDGPGGDGTCLEGYDVTVARILEKRGYCTEAPRMTAEGPRFVLTADGKRFLDELVTP